MTEVRRTKSPIRTDGALSNIDGMSGTVPPQLNGSPPPFRGDKHFRF